MAEPLSVRAVLGHILDFLGHLVSPMLVPLRAIGWDVGDWTFFTPVVTYLLYRLYKHARSRAPEWRHGVVALLIGVLLGGIIEHQQPALERRFTAASPERAHHRHAMLQLWRSMRSPLCLVTAAQAAPIDLTTSPIHLNPEKPAEDRAGVLIWRGGLVLSSSAPEFGGLSSLIVSGDGTRLLAVSDEARWFTARLLYEDERLVGVTDGDLAPMMSPGGDALKSKQGDAEGLAALSPAEIAGDVVVSFERNQRIWRYAFGSEGPEAIPVPLPPPAGLAEAEHNGGIEALDRLPDGRLLAITERTFDAAGAVVGWLVRSDGSEAAPIGVRPHGLFEPTDMAVLPNGDVLLLERRFTMLGGPAMQIRRIPAAAIVPGALLDGPVLVQLRLNYSIDNMEGLAVRKNEKGETLVYILSDDNFSSLQRTLLLMFVLDENAPQPRPR